uniref:CSON002730 protein n=1 Tax=Culicoides sonorensis TaxID=179676 RepID=A0A336LV38_CULSO
MTIMDSMSDGELDNRKASLECLVLNILIRVHNTKTVLDANFNFMTNITTTLSGYLFETAAILNILHNSRVNSGKL